MKTFLFTLALICGSGLSAETLIPRDTFEANTARRAEKTIIKEPEPQYRIVAGDRTYSGIAFALVKADNKLQLLNPVAPEKYGTAENSVTRDPISGRVSGLKISSINF